MTAGGGEVGAKPFVRFGNFVFRYRDALFPAVLLALFLGFRPQYPRGSERLDNLLDIAGIAVALSGQLLRVWVIGYAYIIRGGQNRQVYAKDLVTDGFFAHSRNPLYLGNLLVLLGLFLIYHNPWVYALGGTFFLISYAAIVAAEEAYLREKFGPGYDAYTRAVPRWLPRIRGLRQSMEGTRFNWRRVVLKEYTSTFTWMAGAVVLLAADTLAHHPYRERAAYLTALWVCLAVLTLGWAAARYLKKSRRLRAAPMSRA
jgi:protein-S-isoprenylcysteine O-methyltransferase Ste14